jgi:hypothetical protein
LIGDDYDGSDTASHDDRDVRNCSHYRTRLIYDLTPQESDPLLFMRVPIGERGFPETSGPLFENRFLPVPYTVIQRLEALRHSCFSFDFSF